eukprot:gnl/TRDRNA2_/TRDRNA2_120639_c0_seq1.p1 gnl/TRDRNA2_/TRDRNA2_120639_c0~~gnl/TRDRNA2_/TRDRNA2_120639_c0_seq1.p1  ORF type:complete len:252 (-),score=46.22 gnl/TRDRNA2_/TRDRNA2_120639_c0_seq1:95-772(-)
MLADALLLLPPYYFCGDASPSWEAGCESFFRSALPSFRLPVFLYNFPRHTQQQITVGMYQRLAADFPRIQGIKDSSGSLSISTAFKKAVPRLEVIVGNDDQILDALEAGIDGVITGASSAIIEVAVALEEASRQGKPANVLQQLQSGLRSWGQMRANLGCQQDISVTKVAYMLRDVACSPKVLPPLTECTEEQRKGIKDWLSTQLPALLKLIEAEGLTRPEVTDE